MLPRRADPYRDTDVIDERAPRTNQAFVGVVSLAAVLTGWWWLLALLALQFALGLTLGRRWCLACVFYFEASNLGSVKGASRTRGRRASRTWSDSGF